MFSRILIANRGEIALRVIRTCRELGVATVAVCTELDREAPHVRAADDVVQIAGYLDIDAIVEAARSSGAEAVHPGYGFLSERSAFARALEDAGITLIGPSAAVMDAMGRKDRAREIAVAAGVPVVPRGEDAGFPVLVKAAAGGGGKGMRVVRSAAEMDEAVAAAKREAASAFGDDTMLVEKYVESGRHIEVQVIADAHGEVLHLFERDCSTQRRHQKVLEEAPAPTITPAQRELVTKSAVALARKVGYENAGTVEFLLDNDTGEAYFLEMNTRLQVEHPVTEAVVRVDGRPVDLVALQLRVAAGEPLGIAQDDVGLEGHAIEARVYAEDAFGGFLPSAGTATRVLWPQSARVDHALESGQTVSTSYDPMLGKVIAHGPDRESARRALLDALDETAIFGFTTNVGFLRALVASEEFRDATIDTGWLDDHEVPAPDDAAARALAGSALSAELARDTSGPFAPDGFRIGGARGPLIEHGRDLTPPADAEIGRIDDVLTVRSPQGHGFVRRTPRGTEVVTRGQRFVLDRDDPFGAAHSAAGDGAITAPMPGTLLSVLVEPGAAVAEGQTLGVMEAMKMELALKAPFAGTVGKVGAVAGAQVAQGAPLFEVEADR